jgi:hypothetical protein
VGGLHCLEHGFSGFLLDDTGHLLICVAMMLVAKAYFPMLMALRAASIAESIALVASSSTTRGFDITGTWAVSISVAMMLVAKAYLPTASSQSQHCLIRKYFGVQGILVSQKLLNLSK